MGTLLLLFISRVSGKLIQTAAGDDVRFALTEECKTGKGTLHHQLMDGTDQLVASLDGVWKPGPGYINRVAHSSDSLILKRADFNDHGYYAFTCNYKQRGELDELHVFLPYKVVAPRDEGAILPCRSVTVGQAVKSVRWRRDGELVLELNPPSKQITYGDGYDESRVSIPSDWNQRGDLSLTVKRAQLRDEGVYYCDVEKTEKHRSAVHLTFSIMAAVFVIVDLLVWLCWFLRNRIFNVCTRSFGGGSSEREEEINLKSVTINKGDAHLCNGTLEGGEGTEEGRESGSDQHMLKSNGNPDFTHH
uniref:Ig-like domain-containing protein n=1 Tax=Oreochromis niloticus TaxID=8128 RepID=A0A669EDW1_ORENI